VGCLRPYSGRGSRPQSKELQLRGCGLMKVPDAVFFLLQGQAPQRCDLSSNALKSIPRKLGTLTTLTCSFVRRNAALGSSLSEGACSLIILDRSIPPSMTALSVAGNPLLSSLPVELGPALGFLAHLDISGCAFKALPAAVLHLQALEVLVCSDNRIEHVDVASLREVLTRLRIFDIQRNPLQPSAAALLQLAPFQVRL
jgi:Leucine-rich repeat (LRR) protein